MNLLHKKRGMCCCEDRSLLPWVLFCSIFPLIAIFVPINYPGFIAYMMYLAWLGWCAKILIQEGCTNSSILMAAAYAGAIFYGFVRVVYFFVNFH